jgi:ABC-type Fe3+-hydroxamate transport system substrate-binding protein
VRVVSLVPSLTETLFDLGAGADVAGITDWCIFPEGLELPRVGGTKNPRVDAIERLKPDIVYMNQEENLAKHAREIEKFARVHVSEPKTVDDVAALFRELGHIHGRDPQPLLDRLTAARAMPQRDFTFAVAIWKKPWMWCGGDTYVSDLVEQTGGRNVLHDQKRYPSIDIADIAADVIFLPDEPYAFTSDDAKAIASSQVVGPFPGHLFTWHGSRTILGLKFLKNLRK